MAEQKIYFKQIANTGGSPGQVLIANATSVTWGDANNTAYLGGTIASGYQTTAGLSANIAAYLPTYTGVVNGSSYATGGTGTGTGGFAANTTALLIGNNTINATLSSTSLAINGATIANSTGANNAFYLGGTIASGYQTTAGLTANIAAYLPTYTGIVNGSSYTTGGTGTGTGGFAANTTALLIGNNTINATLSSSALSINGTTVVNTTTFIGTANNATYLGGTAAAGYQTTAGLSANIAAYLPTYTGVVNGSSHTVGATFIANSTQLTVTTPLSANGGTGTSGYVLTSNGSVGSPYWSQITGVNTAAQYTWTNNQTYAADVFLNNNIDLIFKTTSGANVSFIQQNDDNFVFYSTNTTGGQRAVFSIFANSITSNLSFSTRTVHNGGITIPAGATVLDTTGSQGTAGQVLTSNGTGNVYWSTVSGGSGPVDQTATYSWTNTHSFAANLTIGATADLIISNAAGVYANGGFGTAGQVLTSTGSGNVYWSTVSGGAGGSFTNGAAVAVSNLAFTSTTGTSVGVAYSFINTISNSLDTVFA